MAETRQRLTLKSLLFLVLATGMVASVLAQPIAAKAPHWKDLTPAQKQVLAPFAAEYDHWGAQRRLKWRGIAERYPKMTPEQQQRLQHQMQSWAALTPDQRRVAREQYKSIKSLPPEKKQEMREKWREYQNLPPETKRELAARTPPPPPQLRSSRSNAPATGLGGAGTASTPAPVSPSSAAPPPAAGPMPSPSSPVTPKTTP